MPAARSPCDSAVWQGDAPLSPEHAASRHVENPSSSTWTERSPRSNVPSASVWLRRRPARCQRGGTRGAMHSTAPSGLGGDGAGSGHCLRGHGRHAAVMKGDGAGTTCSWVRGLGQAFTRATLLGAVLCTPAWHSTQRPYYQLCPTAEGL